MIFISWCVAWFLYLPVLCLVDMRCDAMRCDALRYARSSISCQCIYEGCLPFALRWDTRHQVTGGYLPKRFPSLCLSVSVCVCVAWPDQEEPAGRRKEGHASVHSTVCMSRFSGETKQDRVKFGHVSVEKKDQGELLD